MELSKQQTDYTKGIAIAMMLCLHLFNRDYHGLFTPTFFIGKQPLSYYLALVCDCCVWIYCFCSGYGLYISHQTKPETYAQTNRVRLLKLYLNYWVVLLLFAVVLGTVLGKTIDYPGSWLVFIYNFSSLDSSYNGAWWFLSCYALLVILSPVMFRLLNRLPAYGILFGSFLLYVMGYCARIYHPVISEIQLVQLLWHQCFMLANAIFPFVLGALAYRQRWYSRWMQWVAKLPFRTSVLLAIILLLIIAHGFVPSLFVAVFTGVAVVFLFNGLSLSKTAERIFAFLSQHSTNIWLVHLFIFSIFAKEWSYAPQQPLLIFCWVLAWCLLCSYLINWIYLPLQRLVLKTWFAQ